MEVRLLKLYRVQGVLKYHIQTLGGDSLAYFMAKVSYKHEMCPQMLGFQATGCPSFKKITVFLLKLLFQK